jgi:hypothetical protein
MELKDFFQTIAPVPKVIQAIRSEAKRTKASKVTSRKLERELLLIAAKED